VAVTWLALILAPVEALAQATYHLHNEPSALSSVRQLKPVGPDTSAVTVSSANLKNANPPQVVGFASFETQTGVPNVSGSIPSGATVSFTLRMKKSANWGTFYPWARLVLNSASGQALCTATGSPQGQLPTSALTTTATPYTITCPVGETVALTTSDRFFVVAGAEMTAGPGNHNLTVDLTIEHNDSKVTVPAIVPPPPVITTLSPYSGLTGASVVISGANFGALQGTSTVKFNGVTATPTNWAANSITATVPASATSGPVVVTVGGVASNGITFSVSTSGSLGGNVTRVSDGGGISGGAVQALQSGIVKGSATTGAGGAYSIPSLMSGMYDVRTTASGYATEIETGVAVSGSSTTLNITLAVPGTISGQVTAAGSGSPIAAGLTITSGGTVVKTGAANAGGTYSIGGLSPGTYTVSAAAAGYQPTIQSGVVVTEGGTATANISLPIDSASAVRYTYDELGRLKSVVDLTGETAVYTYDAVGNVTAIARHASATVSITTFIPGAGPVGTSVTISGTGFSAVPAENTVRFNGVAAQVSSATSTQLVAVVPAGATTGPITVELTTGSATSSTSFAVGATAAPTVTGFTPTIATASTGLTVSGTNFSTVPSENALELNITGAPVSSATATSLSTTVPFGARSGRVSVMTVNGVGVSTAYLFVSPNPCIPANPGAPPYPPVACAVGDIEATAVVPPTGTATPITVSTAGKIGLVAFEGVTGQRVRILIQPPQFKNWVRALYGATVSGGFDPHVVTGGDSLFDADLPYTGAYTLLVRPVSGGDVGTVNVTVTVCPPSGCSF
jgi:hypothetical protein